MKFIHLTDTHLVTQGEGLYGLDPYKRLQQAVFSICRDHADAAFVALTGDMTHWGGVSEFKALKSALAPLPMPVDLVMGNHDLRHSFYEIFPDGPKDSNGFVQSVRETSMGRCLYLDTSCEGTHMGFYCADRRAWLQQQLSESDDPVFLFMHHAPFHVGISVLDEICLQEAEEFYQVIAPHKHRIRHLFYGHLHRATFGNWRGISNSCMRGTNHQACLDLRAGQKKLDASLEAPAYGVVLVDQDNLVVHMQEYLSDHLIFDNDPPEHIDPYIFARDMRPSILGD